MSRTRHTPPPASPAPARGQRFLMQSSGTAQVVEAIDLAGPVLRFATQTEGDGGFGLTGYLSTDTVDMANGKGSGTSRFRAASGDELLGSFTVQLTPGTTPGAVQVNGLTQFLGGTGVFAGATGSASLSGTGQFLSDTRALVSFNHVGLICLAPPRRTAPKFPLTLGRKTLMDSTFPRALAAACAFAVSALTTLPAAAEVFNVNTSGTSQVVEVINPVGPVLRFATQTTGTGTFGLTSYLSTDIVNLGTGAGSGTNRFVAANGDELLGAFSVQLSPGPTPGSLFLNGVTQFTGGTGLFAGATGSATMEAFGQFISETEAVVSFSHIGQLSLVPEPGTTAMLLAGLGVVGALAWHRRGAAPRLVGAKPGPLHSRWSKGE